MFECALFSLGPFFYIRPCYSGFPLPDGKHEQCPIIMVIKLIANVTNATMKHVYPQYGGLLRWFRNIEHRTHQQTPISGMLSFSLVILRKYYRPGRYGSSTFLARIWHQVDFRMRAFFHSKRISAGRIWVSSCKYLSSPFNQK